MSDGEKVAVLMQLLRQAELFVTDKDLREKIGNVLWGIEKPPRDKTTLYEMFGGEDGTQAERTI